MTMPKSERRVGLNIMGKRLSSFIFIISFLLILISLPAVVFAATASSSKTFLVGLKKDINIDEFIEVKGLQSKKPKKVKNFNMFIVKMNPDEIQNLQNNSEVIFVEADSPVGILSVGNVDKTHDSIKKMEKQAQTVPWGIQDIGVLQALENKIDGKKIRIAVFDTGIYNHPDLKLAGGISFVEGITSYTDDNGHGTHVAGTIAACDNRFGVIGAASGSDIYAVKVLDKYGFGNYSQVIQGIDWAIDNQINIISMSLGGSVNSQALHEAVKEANNKGILIIAAAGNNGSGFSTLLYPALYPEVVSVGAVDKDHRRASFSSTGAELDLVGPGVDILSTTYDGEYGVLSGTSMATPHITGAAADLWSKNRNLICEEIKQKLYETAIPLGDPDEYGHGIVDIDRALGLESAPPNPPSAFNIVYEDKRLAEADKTLMLFIKLAKSAGNISLTQEIEQQYDQLKARNIQLHMLPDDISFSKESVDAIDNYYASLESDFKSLENDYALLIKRYESLVPNNPLYKKEVSVLSYNFQGDGQTVQPGGSATVSLQLFESKTAIYIKVINSNGTVLQSYTHPAASANSVITYTWQTSTSTPESTYIIQFSYPGISTIESFTIYVRSYYTITLNRSVDVITPSECWFKVFKFIPSYTKSYSILTGPYGGYWSDVDTFLQIYYDSKLLNRFDWDDHSGGNGYAKLTNTLNAGQAYYIKLSSFGTPNVCARITVITADSQTITAISPDSYKDISLDIGGDYRVYSLTPYITGTYRIYTGPYYGWGGMNDTYLELYSDANLISRSKENDDVDYPNDNCFSEIIVNLDAGTTYYIKLRPYSSTGIVCARLSVYRLPSIDSESITNLDIPAYERKIYKFTPSTSGTYSIFTNWFNDNCAEGESDTTLYLYNDPTLNSLIKSSNDISLTNKFSAINHSLTGGVPYYIRLNGNNWVRIHTSLHINRTIIISGTNGVSNIIVSDPEQKSVESFGLEPIDFSTGAQVIDNMWLEVTGVRPISLDVHYDSLLSNIGPIGKGWSHNFETRLEELPDGRVVIHWNSNRDNTFTSIGNNQYSSSDLATCFDTLVKNQDGTFTLTRRDQSIYIFNTTGKLTEQRNGRGQSLIMTYDGSGLLIKVTEPISGRYIGFSYNVNTLINNAYDNLGRNVILEYDASKNLIRVTDARGNSTSYTYTANGWMLTLTDAEGIVIFSNTYDNQGRVIQQVDALNHASTLNYDETSEQGRIITTVTDRNGKSKILTHDTNYKLLNIRDELGHQTTYTYDAYGNRTSIRDALGKTATFTYDTRGNMLTSRYEGRTTSMTYDSRNNLLSVENAALKRINYTYDANNNITSITDQLGNITGNTYDSNGLLLSSTKPGMGQTAFIYANGQVHTVTVDGVLKNTFGYDAVGRMVSRTDGNGKITTMTYDEADNLISVIDPLGYTVRYAYDRNNNKISETDARGNITRYAYNGNMKLTSKTDALNNITNYEYDNEDRLIRTTDARGKTITTGYDDKGRPVTITDQLGHTATMQYDELDRVIVERDALGNNTKTVTYDAFGNPLTVTDALNHTVTKHYDILNRLDQTTDPLERITQLSYDDLNRLILVIDPLSGRSRQTFDTDGNRTALIDPNNNQVSFSYDPSGKLTAQTTVAGNSKQFTYNARDLLEQIINGRGQTTNYQYDDKGRLISFTDPAGTVSYTYDVNGNILTVTDGTGTITREYDVLNRITKYIDANGNIVQYNYDQVGNLTTLTYPDGKQVQYTYNDANRLTSVTDWAGRTTSYEYDANGRLTRITRPNGTVLTITYDLAGHVTQQKDIDRNGNTIAQYDFTYDRAGNVTGEQSIPAEQPFTISNAQMTYTGDNCLATVNGQSISYDADGNMTTGPLAGAMSSFTYDSRNRLISAGNTSYAYDAENNRISVTDTVYGTTTYVTNPNASLSQVLVKTNPDGSKTFYIYGLGLTAQEDSAGTYLTYHFDLRGSTIALTDSGGNITDRFQYGPYGELFSHSGNISTPFLYNGRDGVMADGNGLYYMRARYYSPEIKRFINQDVVLGDINNGQGLNRFAYVKGSPVINVDPEGRNGVLALAGGLALIDGPLPVGDIASGIVLLGYAVYELYNWATEDTERTFNEKLEDIKNNPGDWTKTGVDPPEASTNIRNKGGTSVQEEYTNSKTGEKVWKHTLKDKNGQVVDEHYRPYPKQPKKCSRSK